MLCQVDNLTQKLVQQLGGYHSHQFELQNQHRLAMSLARAYRRGLAIFSGYMMDNVGIFCIHVCIWCEIHTIVHISSNRVTSIHVLVVIWWFC